MGSQLKLTEASSRVGEQGSRKEEERTDKREATSRQQASKGSPREEEQLENEIQQARIHLQLLETEEKMRKGDKGGAVNEGNTTASPPVPEYTRRISEGHQYREYTRGREGSVHLEGGRQPLLPTPVARPQEQHPFSQHLQEHWVFQGREQPQSRGRRQTAYYVPGRMVPSRSRLSTSW